MSEIVSTTMGGSAGDVLMEIIQLGSKTKDDCKNNQMPTQQTEYQVYTNLFVQGNPEERPRQTEYIPYDPESRNAFVRKVMFITFVCFLITVAGTAAVFNIPALFEPFKEYYMIFIIVGTVGCVVFETILLCCSFAAKFPINFICLFCFVFFETLFTAALTVRFDTHVIMSAFATTTAVVFVCFCIACTNFDFTKYMIYILMVSLVLGLLAMIISVMMIVFSVRYTPVTLAIMIILTIMQCVVLILQLQLILGGKSAELAETESVIGAFLLYSAIMSIFFYILEMFGQEE